MIDFGRWTNCGNITSYVANLGISAIDYAIATHYDADHIGCLDDLVNQGVEISVACLDHGGSADTQTYDAYVAACGDKRATAFKGQTISLDPGAQVQTTIRVVDLNGAGVNTTNENAKSLVLKVSYGSFDHVFGGDLTGQSPDIESLVAPDVGDVEVYKVQHHGSDTSTNQNWLNATSPEVAVISVGNNSFGHPTAGVLSRLHDLGVKTYWTNTGSGVTPDPANDFVGGTIVITIRPDLGDQYSVTGSGFSHTYFND